MSKVQRWIGRVWGTLGLVHQDSVMTSVCRVATHGRLGSKTGLWSSFSEQGAATH